MTNNTAPALKFNRKAEAKRLDKILRSPEGKALPRLAEHLAFDLDLTASRSIRVMKAALRDHDPKGETDD